VAAVPYLRRIPCGVLTRVFSENASRRCLCPPSLRSNYFPPTARSFLNVVFLEPRRLHIRGCFLPGESSISNSDSLRDLCYLSAIPIHRWLLMRSGMHSFFFSFLIQSTLGVTIDPSTRAWIVAFFDAASLPRKFWNKGLRSCFLMHFPLAVPLL